MTWDDGDVTTVTVGDLISNGLTGDQIQVGVVAWTDSSGSTDLACVRVIWIVPPVGDGQWGGTAAPTGEHGVLAEHLGFGEAGHMWKLKPGWNRVTTPWWNFFRYKDFH